MWLRKRNLLRETESLLIAARNKIRNKHMKVRIYKTIQNSGCRFCGDWDETINHKISECRKLAQEYKTRHDWVGKVIHWELCKKFKFDHRNKWYMHNLDSAMDNDTHKLLWDFEIKSNHLISARRPDLIIINKKEIIWRIVDSAVPTDHRVKLKECEKRDKCFVRELKMWVKITLSAIGVLGMVIKRLVQGLEYLEKTGRVETVQSTEFMRLARILRRIWETGGDFYH